jgi:hypothetical protein
MIPYLTCIKVRVELMLLYWANENHTIKVLVFIGILNARFIFTSYHKAFRADYISRSTSTARIYLIRVFRCIVDINLTKTIVRNSIGDFVSLNRMVVFLSS